MIKPATVLALI